MQRVEGHAGCHPAFSICVKQMNDEYLRGDYVRWFRDSVCAESEARCQFCLTSEAQHPTSFG